MSSVALEPRTFRDTTSRLSSIWTSRSAALLMLFALAAIVVTPAMSRGRLFPRPTPYVATMQYAAERLRGGELPLWNPHEHFGEPVTRDGRSALWYPATLLLATLPQPQAWHAIAILHLWLAGLGALLLAGRYGLEPVPRLMCGVVYMLCGMTVLGLESAQANVLIWLPWAALTVERLSERVTGLRILLAALVLTVQFLGGDLFASGALLATCTLALLIRAFWIGPKRWTAAIVACVIAMIIAVAAAAVQWLPVFWPWQANPLGALADVRRSWPWGAGPLLIAPTSPALFGAVPLALAAIAIGFGRRPRAVVLWTVVGAVLALTVIGFEAWARFGNDAIGAWPRPRVLTAGVCLAVAVLAGFGIETVVALAADRAARLRARLFSASFAVAAVAGTIAVYYEKFTSAELSGELLLHCTRMLAGASVVCAAALVVRSHELPQWRSRGWSWVALACAELLAFALPATRGVPIRNLGSVSDVATYFRSRREPARFIEAGGSGLPESFATWQSLEDAGGAGRGSARHELWSLTAAAAGGRNGPDVLRVANVRYLVTEQGAPQPPPPWRHAHRSGSLTIYEDADPLPRAWLTREGRRVDLPEHALAPLVSTQPVNPREVALLDDVNIDPADRALINERPDYWSRVAGEGGASDLAYATPSPEEVRVNVPSGAAGWLVVSDSFASGWHASIDGQPAPIVAAFAAFRAVRVPAGAGDVVFRYEPREWRYAILTSAGGGGAMLILLAWSIVRGRHKPEGLPYRVAR